LRGAARRPDVTHQESPNVAAKKPVKKPAKPAAKPAAKKTPKKKPANTAQFQQAQ